MKPQWERASEFLLGLQKGDGGIPAVQPSDPTGCWTSAEVLDFLLSEHHLGLKYLKKTRALIQFLLQNQVQGAGWPLTTGSSTSSTMATGHALRALRKAQRTEGLFTQTSKLGTSISQATGWLLELQHTNGGWGVEPETSEGAEPRIISTYYAIYGLTGLGQSATASPQTLSATSEFLRTAMNQDHGWGIKKGAVSDVGSTARALLTLQQSYFAFDYSLYRDSYDFILANKDQWRIDVEAYVAGGSPGHIFFHTNTICDIGNLLANTDFERYIDELSAIFYFLSEKQKHDGRWHLVDFHKEDPNTTMWSTAEYARFLCDFTYRHAQHLASRNGQRMLLPQPNTQVAPTRWHRTKNFAITILILLLLQEYFGWFPIFMEFFRKGVTLIETTIVSVLNAWDSLSLPWKWITGLLGTAVLALAVNLLTPWASKLLRRARSFGTNILSKLRNRRKNAKERSDGNR